MPARCDASFPGARRQITGDYPAARDRAASLCDQGGMKKTSLPALALVATLAASSAGCYGSYGAFNKLHKWNGTVGDKWVNSAVHFGLWIIPVYELALAGDFLVFNTIEHFTGSNPFK